MVGSHSGSGLCLLSSVLLSPLADWPEFAQSAINIDNMSIFEALVRDGGPLSSRNVIATGEKFS